MKTLQETSQNYLPINKIILIRITNLQNKEYLFSEYEEVFLEQIFEFILLTLESNKSRLSLSFRSITIGGLQSCNDGELWVEGSFTDSRESDIRLHLTTSVTSADQRRGYTMIGSLQKGSRKRGSWQTTHLAVTKEKAFPGN